MLRGVKQGRAFSRLNGENPAALSLPSALFMPGMGRHFRMLDSGLSMLPLQGIKDLIFSPISLWNKNPPTTMTGSVRLSTTDSANDRRSGTQRHKHRVVIISPYNSQSI